MEALPIRPQGPHHAPHRHRPAQATHRTVAAGTAHAPHAAAAPGDMAALEEQAAFDAVASARAEQQRQMNVLRDMAMMQVKRDDMALNAWIKLI
jgi:hypothetical protein